MNMDNKINEVYPYASKMSLNFLAESTMVYRSEVSS